MIPHRMPSNEIFEHGLKDRVTECRKRLRFNRGAHKVHFNDEPEAFGREAAAFLNEDLPVRESLISSRDASELRDGEAWRRVEQEVGIT